MEGSNITILIAFAAGLLSFLTPCVLPRGPLGAATLRVAFGAGWSPCLGAIPGGIVGRAAASGGGKNGLVLSGFYAAGLAVPFLLTGLVLNQFLGFYSLFRRHLHKVEVASGVMLIVIGLMVASNSLTWIAGVASRHMINLEGILQRQPPPTDAGAKNQTAQAS